MELTGRTVLLTGASRGIGALLATELAKHRPHLVLVARDARELETVALRCRETGARVTAVAADISSAADRERLRQTSGTVDVLINNAGVETTMMLTDQAREHVEAQIATNLVAPIELTRLALPAMIARRRGVVAHGCAGAQVDGCAGGLPPPRRARVQIPEATYPQG